MKVKICGVTSVDDARMSCDLGADAVGLNFYEHSPRCLELGRAARITRVIPPLVSVVGVFVNASVRHVRRVVREVGLTAVQLHGEETDLFARQMPCPVIRVAHLKGRQIPRLPRASLLLLDAAQPGYGGGGITLNWAVAKRIARQRAIVLAGGLTPDNVRRAVQTVRPFGVDVASGVERAPGRKDHRKLAAFLRAARSAS